MKKRRNAILIIVLTTAHQIQDMSKSNSGKMERSINPEMIFNSIQTVFAHRQYQESKSFHLLRMK